MSSVVMLLAGMMVMMVVVMMLMVVTTTALLGTLIRNQPIIHVHPRENQGTQRNDCHRTNQINRCKLHPGQAEQSGHGSHIHQGRGGQHTQTD